MRAPHTRSPEVEDAHHFQEDMIWEVGSTHIGLAVLALFSMFYVMLHVFLHKERRERLPFLFVFVFKENVE